MKNNENNIIGYIEGYYGRLLSWKDRKLIIKSLHKNKMNTYFYAPKEDVCHRIHWRKEYGKKWRNDFRDFIQFSKLNDIKVIAGIAPGLDFNFKELNDISQNNKKSDFTFSPARNCWSIFACSLTGHWRNHDCSNGSWIDRKFNHKPSGKCNNRNSADSNRIDWRSGI